MIQQYLDPMSDPIFSELNQKHFTAFKKFHIENPKVYELVKRFAYEAKARGRGRFGIKMIWERIRWYAHIETSDEQYKLPNNFHSFYARLLMLDDPYFMDLFRRRTSNKDH